jgi:hypothetical protein
VKDWTNLTLAHAVPEQQITERIRPIAGRAQRGRS